MLTGWRLGATTTPSATRRSSIPPGTSRARRPCWASATPKVPTRWPPCCATWRATRPRRSFVATKLARHFVADDPPPALVDRLAASYRASGGELAEVYRTLIRSPEAWAQQPAKLKTPEEFAVVEQRACWGWANGSPSVGRRTPGGQWLSALGQRVHAAPSPAGWPDRAEDWLGPDAVWKRVEWATRVADRLGPRRRRAHARREQPGAAGSVDATRLQIERAADGPQALALLLMAPEFQRR